MMNQIEIEFLDTYKRVDKICADMYSSENGITEYIAQMELKDGHGRHKVTGWEGSYRSLKHLRWLRNQLVHEVDPKECTEQDVDELKMFYRQIMSQQDPLAMLYKTERRTANSRKKTDRGDNSTDRGNENNRKRQLAMVLGMVALVIVLIILLASKM